MAKKQIRIWVDVDTLSRIKAGAVQGGRSLSDFADATLRRGLAWEGEGERPSHGHSTDGPDPETLRKAVETAIRLAGLDELKTGIGDLGRLLLEVREKVLGPGASSGYPWTKEQVRHLVYAAARLDKFFTVFNADWGRNDANVGTRARVANEAGDRAVQKFGLKEDDHAR